MPCVQLSHYLLKRKLFTCSHDDGAIGSTIVMRVETGKLCLWTNTGWPFVFVHKVWLGHNHVYSFTYCLWLFSCYSDRVEWLWLRLVWLSSQKYLLSDPSRNLRNPALEDGRETIWKGLNDFEQRPGWSEAGTSHLDIREDTSGNGNSRCTGPEVG